MTTWDKEKMRLWMRKERVRRKAEGLCVNCGKTPIVDGKTLCARCLGLISANNAKRRKTK